MLSPLDFTGPIAYFPPEQNWELPGDHRCRDAIVVSLETARLGVEKEHPMRALRCKGMGLEVAQGKHV